MQGIFVSAITYTPPVILGRQLLPFSPFHGLLLEAASSPFLIGGDRDFDDVILGAWVCSHSFSDGYLGTMDYDSIRAWSKGCKELKPDEEDQAIRDFGAYVEASLTKPEHWESKEDKDCRAPVWWMMATFGMNRLHMSERKAWDCSTIKLLCYSACRNEMKGDDTLMTDEENAWRESGKAQRDKGTEAQSKKGGEGKGAESAGEGEQNPSKVDAEKEEKTTADNTDPTSPGGYEGQMGADGEKKE